jgi:DUF4097 and DUF4098 domain-containing protein YvlB
MVLPLAALFFLAASLQPAQQEEFQKVLPLSAQGTFRLDNVNGNVTITTWKEAKAEIKAVKKTNKDAENLQKVKIEVTGSADAISVKTIHPEPDRTGVSVDYTVSLPEGVRLDKVSSVNGRVAVAGPLSAVNASTVNGEVRVEKASGNLRLETTNGNVEAVEVRGKIEAETTNGSIRLQLNQLEGDVRATTTNGGITLSFAGAQEPNGQLEAQTTNGGIDIAFPITLRGLEKNKHHLRCQIGSGGPSLFLETVNGSIHLTR